jgi:hypothetical protein
LSNVGAHVKSHPRDASGLDEIDSEKISTEKAQELRGALLDAFYRASNKADSRRLLDTLAAANEKSIKDEPVK